MRIIRRGEGRSEPRVLVGRVVGNEVDKDLQPSFVGALDELVEVLERPVLGVDVVVVGHVVAVVLLRRGIERSDPYRVDSQTLEVIETRGDSRQVANAVVVRIGEASDVDLVEDRAAPPRGRPTLTAPQRRNLSRRCASTSHSVARHRSRP